MVPSAFVFLDALPLTPSGKVNRRALPPPDPAPIPEGEPSAPARTPTEKVLSQIWRDILGLRQVSVEQNFFELGGHSLLAVQVVKRVAESFSRQLPVSTIFQFPTIEKLAAVLDRGDDAATAANSIVEIQPRGAQPPLFLVHGAGGGMFWGYANLARHLGVDQPLYAFKSRGLDGLPEHGSIPEMAASYVADLRAFQPRGPYRLGGYCYGGIVAQEMARQIEGLGETVALLAVFNAWPAQSSYTRPRFSPRLGLKFFQNATQWVRYTLGLPRAQQRELLVWKAKAVGRKFMRLTSRLRARAQDVDLAQWVDLSHQPQDRHELWASHIRSYLAHRPQPFGGRLTLFRTRCHPLICSFDEACGWSEFARGGVTSVVVPGAHESILDEPHVAVLARELARALQTARNSTPPTPGRPAQEQTRDNEGRDSEGVPLAADHARFNSQTPLEAEAKPNAVPSLSLENPLS
jgi:thioesterase domain-containing protein